VLIGYHAGFVAQEHGLRTLLECLLEAEPRELLSRRLLVNLFGSMEELAEQWEARLNRARSSATIEQYRAKEHVRRTRLEGHLEDALTWSLQLLNEHPDWERVAMEAFETALVSGDAEKGLQVIPYLLATAREDCYQNWLRLSQALLLDITGQRDAAVHIYKQVSSQGTTPQLRTIANRCLRQRPTPWQAWRRIRYELF